MKAIILPTQPKWVEKILNSEKTIEVRTRMRCDIQHKERGNEHTERK